MEPTMAAMDDLLKSLPIDQLAGKLGVDPATAESAAGSVLPAIFGGLQANADDPAGAASIDNALSQHSPQLVEGGINLDDVDTDDGEKIAGHIFGPQKDQVVAKLSESTGTEPGLLSKLLPTLAPIALSYLSKQLQARGQAPGGAASGQTAASGGGDIGNVLGSLLGGGSEASGGAGGFDIGSILGGLGGLLGGGRR
jgi:hypothetical protein